VTTLSIRYVSPSAGVVIETVGHSTTFPKMLKPPVSVWFPTPPLTRWPEAS
jgi:hypothetical protein